MRRGGGGRPVRWSSLTWSLLPAEVMGATTGELAGVSGCSQGVQPSHVLSPAHHPLQGPPGLRAQLLFEKGVAVPLVCSLLPQWSIRDCCPLRLLPARRRAAG